MDGGVAVQDLDVLGPDGFLGSGVAFPIEREAGDRLRMAHGEEKIRESIRIILSTSPGERVMRPDFGCRIRDFVFAVNDASTRGAISAAVDDALSVWEPRIEVLGVDTVTDPGDRRRLLVSIAYRVRSSNSRVNLVYPFYLG